MALDIRLPDWTAWAEGTAPRQAHGLVLPWESSGLGLELRSLRRSFLTQGFEVRGVSSFPSFQWWERVFQNFYVRLEEEVKQA